jgi:Dyp-type peroxidase family
LHHFDNQRINAMNTSTPRLSNIQGNIFGGFNKDFQTFLFLNFKDACTGRAWIDEIAGSISNSADVLKFNNQFKALKAQGLKPETIISATWTNLALAFEGLKAVAAGEDGFEQFPQAFQEGMAVRKGKIGDVEDSDPSKWIEPFRSTKVHAVLLVAADSAQDLASRVNEITTSPGFQAGVDVLLQQEGRTRVDQPGHEHFGFKDGVSQPGIRGIDLPDDPIGNPDQGHPGQDLLWPGEFVLGYPTQIPTAEPGHDGPNRNPGVISKSGPDWTEDGSYLVFRRLEQNVPAFSEHVASLAQQQGSSVDLMGAKLVGRYKSGCPLERREFQSEPFVVSPTDPGIANPALANDDTLNNNFEFGDDADGTICPRAAHIRKTYPRDEQTFPEPDAVNSESATQTHRLLRRGIPFGNSFAATEGGGADDPRGLLFLAYQADIERQFEFVQRFWVNNPKFPGFPKGAAEPGQDPIIAQSQSGPFELDPKEPAIQVQHFVTTTGGEYFFAPSIDALRRIGAGQI